MLLAIAAGGAAGAVARYLVMVGMTRWLGSGFPWGTITVNVVGSFLLGALIEALALRVHLSPEWRAFIVVGCMGAFTTFSTFSLDVVSLAQRGAWTPAFLYIAGSVILSVGALLGGMRLFRLVLGPSL